MVASNPALTSYVRVCWLHHYLVIIAHNSALIHVRTRATCFMQSLNLTIVADTHQYALEGTSTRKT